MERIGATRSGVALKLTLVNLVVERTTKQRLLLTSNMYSLNKNIITSNKSTNTSNMNISRPSKNITLNRSIIIITVCIKKNEDTDREVTVEIEVEIDSMVIIMKTTEEIKGEMKGMEGTNTLVIIEVNMNKMVTEIAVEAEVLTGAEVGTTTETEIGIEVGISMTVIGIGGTGEVAVETGKEIGTETIIVKQGIKVAAIVEAIVEAKAGLRSTQAKTTTAISLQVVLFIIRNMVRDKRKTRTRSNSQIRISCLVFSLAASTATSSSVSPVKMVKYQKREKSEKSHYYTIPHHGLLLICLNHTTDTATVDAMRIILSDSLTSPQFINITSYHNNMVLQINLTSIVMGTTKGIITIINSNNRRWRVARYRIPPK